MSNQTRLSTIEGRRTDTGERVRLTIDGGRIHSLENVDDDYTASYDDDLWIAPGLVDLQINGYCGHDINQSDIAIEQRVETVKRLVREVLASGTTTFCPTVITAGFSQIMDCMTAIRLACEEDSLTSQTVAGIHLEGPYISVEDGSRGAHPKEHVRNPDLNEFMQWQKAADGRIRIVTLAPEKEGSVPFIRNLTQEGILISIGHTSATHEDIIAAIEAGATMSTHLGNGAHSQLPRHPNYIWSQLSEDQLMASIICDGHHLHSSVVKVMARVKGERMVLVSDAVHLAGLTPGKYHTHVGGDVELLPSGRLQMVSNPLLLAGSAVSLAYCVGRYVSFTESSLSSAIDMATRIPARLIGLSDTGDLEIGSWADLIVYRWDNNTQQIWLQSVIKRGLIFA
jgi:N-acetylglucosamine-6-phosphate deacetylase